jgi:hypothetical protein
MSLSTLNHPAATAAAATGRGRSFSPAVPAPPSVRLSRRRLPAPVSASALAVEAAAAADRVSALSQVSGVLGSQWGDEGKGKLVDVLAPRFDIVARCQVRRYGPVFWLCSGLPAVLILDWKLPGSAVARSSGNSDTASQTGSS